MLLMNVFFFYMLGYVVLVQIRESLCVIRSEEAPGPNFKCHNFGMILFHISFKMSIFIRLILVLFVNITFKWASQLINHSLLFFFVRLQRGDSHAWRYGTAVRCLVSGDVTE